MDYLEICQCIEETCVCDKKAPYKYLDEEHRKLVDCKCKETRVKIEYIKRSLRHSNIPIKYQYRRINEFEINPAMAIALDEARHFIDDYDVNTPGKQKGMYFFGPPGTGKTMLACIIANELIIKHQIRVAYAKISRDFFNKIRASFSADSAMYGKGEDIFQKLASVNLLILDDFGVQADSEWEKRTLYDLIDARYENQQPLLLTSNVIPDDWKTLFNGRIYSRLLEMTKFIDMISDDYRFQHSGKL